MKISLFTLTSFIHDPAVIEQQSVAFLQEISQAVDCEFDVKGDDFSLYDAATMPVIFVRTGGTEGIFKAAFSQIKGSYVRLLTSGMSNSLAASMEILSYLQQQGCQGEIYHGSPSYIAQRLQTDYRVEQARLRLRDTRLGVIGTPSDWLIASGVDRHTLKEKLGIEMFDIAIDELVETYHSLDETSELWKAICESPEFLRFEAHAPEALKTYRNGAFRLYGALAQLVEKYELSGFTLRCFDLLSLVHNTGCMALAMFNAQGIPACCEGDIPALLTMTIGQALTGQTGFQANPSRLDVDGGEITFAHCTMPLNMVRSYGYDTHFESGIGIGLKGEFAKGPMTIAKISGDLGRSWFCPATLCKNLSERNLCRTQVVLRGSGFADYFLTHPIGNHHILFTGNQTLLFETFMKRMGDDKPF